MSVFQQLDKKRITSVLMVLFGIFPLECFSAEPDQQVMAILEDAEDMSTCELAKEFGVLFKTNWEENQVEEWQSRAMFIHTIDYYFAHSLTRLMYHKITGL